MSNKLYVKIKIANNHEAWLESRKKGIGGSDAAAALGMSPYKSKYTLWCEKTGLIDGSIEDNEAMRQGRDLESYVAQRFCEATGKKVKRSSYYYRSRENPFMQANVDRLVVGEDAGLECKTVNALTRTKYDKGDIPIQYYLQCLHYMTVTGMRKWYIAILVLGVGFYYFEVDWDDEEIKTLVANERAFWHLVENNIDPIIDDSDSTAETLYKLYPNSDSALTVSFDDTVDYTRLEELNMLIKKLDSEKQGIINNIKGQMGDSEVGYGNGYKASWKTVQTSKIDSKKLKSNYPDVYSECLKTTSQRRFTYKRIEAEE